MLRIPPLYAKIAGNRTFFNFKIFSAHTNSWVEQISWVGFFSKTPENRYPKIAKKEKFKNSKIPYFMTHA